MELPDPPPPSPGAWSDFSFSAEACSEACPGFHRLSQTGWSDYGLCQNPRSPRCGAPMLVGRMCPYFLRQPASREV